MTLIAPRTSIAARPHRVMVQSPGAVVADGDGGYTQTPADVAPVYAAIEPASARNLEGIVASTVLATATHLITIPYRAGVTTQTRVTFNGREFAVAGVANLGERNVELLLVCAEVVP